MQQTEPLTKSVIQRLEQAVQDYSAILVAYSGGVDSSVLLHGLVLLRNTKRPDLKLRAIYIHHGLSQQADNWARHCEQTCQQSGVECLIRYVNLEPSGNIESQAREARYESIEQVLLPQEVLCTAQHLDDQCETFLLALKRGSGPTGLSSMPVVTSFGQTQLLRPLLSFSRQQIEQYAQENALSWVEDESNQDDKYDRNFLRLRVLPVLQQRWPQFTQMVSRSAQLCAEQQQLLDELLSEHLSTLTGEQGCLLIEPLLNDSEAKRNALLRLWFKFHNVPMPSRQQLTIIWQEVALAREDATPQFILDNHQIRRYQQCLYLLPAMRPIENIRISWDLKTPINLPDNLGVLTAILEQHMGQLRQPTEQETVSIRFQAQGKFAIVGRTGSRSLKKIWQEYQIAPWLRQRTPLIYYNDTLICAVGVFVTLEGQGTELSISYQ
ncbi:tRNA lysidine(34) synthetase TilS [Zophobihabitans entericus]|uniref:tRNA(Ile)-lysidine synthase n=1 Tax=Zophobihabitans entericus TaxID=1635327 RepID=A0A6G9IA20_9GAMM|nr:tRNA lysidine(34) synthetase TilS [Zophobihabitans entericus]QIQ20679.1 tRNA lysidine(34) synthetase TilS [Zophobihabitans entericus]